MDKAPLTPKQEAVYNFLVKKMQNGIPPSVREICVATGIKSTSTVHAILGVLEEQGYILRYAKYSRAIRLENNFDAVFEETPFSQLTCGGIKITRKAPLQTEPPVAEPENTPAPEANNNVPPQEAPTESNNSQPDTNNQNSDQETQTQAVTEEVTTAAETTETTATQTEVTTVTVTEKTTVTTEETTVSATDTTTVSEASVTSENVEESEEKSNNILHIIIPVSIAAVLALSFYVIKKVRKNKS